MHPLLRAAIAAFTLAVVAAPPALANTVITQTLPPGGTISTGSDATPDNPVQMQVTVPSGGEVTLAKIDHAASLEASAAQEARLVGPGFNLVPPRNTCEPGQTCEYYVNQRLSFRFIVDRSAYPRDPKAYPQNLSQFYLSQDGKAARSALENGLGTVGRVLPNGDYEFTGDTQARALEDYQTGFSVGHVASFSPAYVRFIGDTPFSFRSSPREYGSFDELQRHFKLRAVCNWLCSVSIDLSVSPNVARKLKLSSRTLLKIRGLTQTPKTFLLPANVRRAIGLYSRVPITFTTVATPLDPLASPIRGRITITYVNQEEDLG